MSFIGLISHNRRTALLSFSLPVKIHACSGIDRRAFYLIATEQAENVNLLMQVR